MVAAPQFFSGVPMKRMLALIFALSSPAAFAATQPLVSAAHYNSSTQSIEVTIAYSGGCEAHRFKLEMQTCLRSFPLHCLAKIVDVNSKPDLCEAFVKQTVSFDPVEYGLAGPQYGGASLSISGANTTQATVQLP
jgi:hypothetical protein